MDTSVSQDKSSVPAPASEIANAAGTGAGLITLSTDTQVQQALIANGYNSTFTVANAPREEFVSKMGASLGAGQAAQILATARAQAGLLNTILVGERAEQANTVASDPTNCDDCHAAVSPLAYLADLLDYVTQHVATKTSDLGAPVLGAGGSGLLSTTTNQTSVGPQQPDNVTNPAIPPTPVINGGQPDPINPLVRYFAGTLNVTITPGGTPPPAVDIYYTLDGTRPDPSKTNESYSGDPIPISTSHTVLQAMAVYLRDTVARSAIAKVEFAYYVVATPTITPNGGASYTLPVAVTLATTTSGAQIRYTTDGTDPTDQSALYSGPFLLPSSATVKARAYSTGMDASVVTSAAFTITQVLASPTFSPLQGSYSTSIDVTLAAALGASVYFFVGKTGTNPPSDLSQWPTYSNTKPLHLESSSSVWAYAKKDGTQSAQVTAQYTLKMAPPEISPPGGLFVLPILVGLYASSPDAKIFYTTNGHKPDPQITSERYGGPFQLTSNATVKAIAVQGQGSLEPSDVVQADFTANPLQLVTLSDLTGFFHQPFGDLPISCESVTAPLPQVRICVEVLRDYLKALRPIPDLSRAERAYCLTAYTTLLTKIGTSYNEIRLARGDDPTNRQALADRLGIELGTSHPDHLGALFVEPNDLAEQVLGTLFGLQDTTRDPLSDGVKIPIFRYPSARV